MVVPLRKVCANDVSWSTAFDRIFYGRPYVEQREVMLGHVQDDLSKQMGRCRQQSKRNEVMAELIISEMVVRNAEKLSCHTMANPDTFNSYQVI